VRICCSKIGHSRRWLSIVVLLLVGLTFVGCTGRTTIPRGWSGGTVDGNNLYVGTMDGRVIAVNIVDGSRLWASEQLKMAATSTAFGCSQGPTTVAIYGSPAVSDNLVYVGGYYGRIYAFAVGKEKPRVYPSEDTTIDGSIVGGVIVAQGKAFLGASNGIVYALPAAGGFEAWTEKWKAVWTFQTGSKIWSTPAVAGDTVFIGTFGKKLYALNADNGTEKWHFTTEGAIVATPVVDGNTVYIGSFDRYLYALDTATGSLKWKFQADNWFWAKPVVNNGVIYVGNLDGKLYVLKADTGEKVTELDLNSPISSSLVLVGDSVVVATEAGIVYVVDTANNEKKELASLGEKVFASLSAGQGSVFVHTAKDALYAVDAATGALRQFTIK
jgi:outer membrane protein assembly factor BamB